MTKIEALEKTIYNLENDVYKYNWDNSENCNCGVLAKTILSLDDSVPLWKHGFLDSPKQDDSLSPFCREAFCITTNLPLPEVFKSLKDIGFSINELIGLENLSDELVTKKLGWQTYEYNGFKIVWHGVSRSQKNNVITYLKAWVEILKEQEPKTETPKPKEVIRYVSVPTSIIEQEKELVLN